MNCERLQPIPLQAEIDFAPGGIINVWMYDDDRYDDEPYPQFCFNDLLFRSVADYMGADGSMDEECRSALEVLAAHVNGILSGKCHDRLMELLNERLK
jgi:hypothetical protein